MSAPAERAEIELDPERVVGWLGEDGALQLIDVRESYEREAGHIEGSRHIELDELSAQAATVGRGRPVVFYCRVGLRSDCRAGSADRLAGCTWIPLR